MSWNDEKHCLDFKILERRIPISFALTHNECRRIYDAHESGQWIYEGEYQGYLVQITIDYVWNPTMGHQKNVSVGVCSLDRTSQRCLGSTKYCFGPVDNFTRVVVDLVVEVIRDYL